MEFLEKDLEQIIEAVSFYTYHITLNGLKFKCRFGYKLTNEGF